MASLAGLRVWITRPGTAARASAERWRARGAEVLAHPLLRIESLDLDDDLRARALEPPADLVVLSSPNAAEHLVRALGATAPGGEPWPVAAVGPATARRAGALGLSVRHVAARATGADLAAELCEGGPPRRVLLPGSDRQRPTLARALEAAGTEVVILTLFRTVFVDALGDELLERLRAGGLDLLVAYSPSAVDAWVERRPEGVELPLAAIGSTTAERVRAHGLDLVAVPASPGEEALLDAVAGWWDEARRA